MPDMPHLLMLHASFRHQVVHARTFYMMEPLTDEPNLACAGEGRAEGAAAGVEGRQWLRSGTVHICRHCDGGTNIFL